MNILNLSTKELEEFDEASSHPHECPCNLCKKWWKLMGKEE